MSTRVELCLKLDKQLSFSRMMGWKEITTRMFIMSDNDGKKYVWKTQSAFLEMPDDSPSLPGFDVVRKGDMFTCKATIKGESEYKGEKQTDLQRVTVLSITHGKTQAEMTAEKQQKQLESLQGGDFVWTSMLYSQYKKHYSDCEIVAGSFHRDDYSPSTVDVIIREGRLVPSGVRGQHYSGYEFKVVTEEKTYRVVYRAVNEDNAVKRAYKEFPDALEIIPGKIYQYGN